MRFVFTTEKQLPKKRPREQPAAAGAHERVRDLLTLSRLSATAPPPPRTWALTHALFFAIGSGLEVCGFGAASSSLPLFEGVVTRKQEASNVFWEVGGRRLTTDVDNGKFRVQRASTIEYTGPLLLTVKRTRVTHTMWHEWPLDHSALRVHGFRSDVEAEPWFVGVPELRPDKQGWSIGSVDRLEVYRSLGVARYDKTHFQISIGDTTGIYSWWMEVEPVAVPTPAGNIPEKKVACDCDSRFLLVEAHRAARSRLWSQSWNTYLTVSSVLFLTHTDQMCSLDDLELARLAAPRNSPPIRLIVVVPNEPASKHALNQVRNALQPKDGDDCWARSRRVQHRSRPFPLMEIRPDRVTVEELSTLWTLEAMNHLRSVLRNAQTLTVVSWDTLPLSTDSTLHRLLRQSQAKCQFLLSRLATLCARGVPVYWMGSLQCDCTPCVVAEHNGQKESPAGEQCSVLDTLRTRSKEFGWDMLLVTTATKEEDNHTMQCTHTLGASIPCTALVYFVMHHP